MSIIPETIIFALIRFTEVVLYPFALIYKIDFIPVRIFFFVLLTIFYLICTWAFISILRGDCSIPFITMPKKEKK